MPSARHILTYAQMLGPGGVERAQLRLAGEWVEAGRRVTLVLGVPAGPLAADLPDGVETVVVGAPGFGALLRAVPAAVARARPDVIFCPGSHYTSIAGWTRARLGQRCPPIVAKLSNAARRGDHGPVYASGHRAWLALHRYFIDHLVAMSPATAAIAARAYRLPPARVGVIANPPALRCGAPVALPAGRYLIGVGRLERQKRWDRAIAALPRVADRGVSLLLLGEGEERARLRAQARALGVGDRVHLPGHAADPLPAMAGAAALVLPSDFEGVPGVLGEALSVGTPVVATDSSPAVAEIVTAPSRGTIVPRADSAALVAALDHWLAPGRARPAPVPLAGSDSAARYLTLFDRLVANGSRPPPGEE